MGQRADDRGDGAFAELADLYRRAAPRSELRRELDTWAENALAAARTVMERIGEPAAAGVSDVELESAFEVAEPEIEAMITPDSVAEAALLADPAPEERSPLAASGAFATRTMAELLERQGDSRGAARIRAALGESVDRRAPAPQSNAVAIAALERWLENVRRARP